MNENIITVSGNLCTPPEIRQTRTGTPMLTFRVASTHRYYSNRSGQWEEGVANFYDVVAYRQLALNAGKSLGLGDAVVLQGQLKQRRFERQDGSFGMGSEIEARFLGPDLAYGIAKFVRAPRAQGRGQDGQAQDGRGPGNGGLHHTNGHSPTGMAGQAQVSNAQVSTGQIGGAQPGSGHRGDSLGQDPWQGIASQDGAAGAEWPDPHTGEVRASGEVQAAVGSLDPDAMGFDVSKDDEPIRSFAAREPSEEEGGPVEEHEDELVGATE